MTADERFDRIDTMLERLEKRFENIDDRFDRLEQYILAFRRETASRMDSFETKLDVVRSTAASFDSARALVDKTLMDVTSNNVKLAAQQWEHKDLTMDLVKRVAKLEEAVAKLSKPAA